MGEASLCTSCLMTLWKSSSIRFRQSQDGRSASLDDTQKVFFETRLVRVFYCLGFTCSQDSPRDSLDVDSRIVRRTESTPAARAPCSITRLQGGARLVLRDRCIGASTQRQSLADSAERRAHLFRQPRQTEQCVCRERQAPSRLLPFLRYAGNRPGDHLESAKPREVGTDRPYAYREPSSRSIE